MRNQIPNRSVERITEVVRPDIHDIRSLTATGPIAVTAPRPSLPDGDDGRIGRSPR